MVDLDELYEKLRRAGAFRRRAGWLVRRAGRGDWSGPYAAVEVAYLIWSGRLQGGDRVAHRQGRRQYVIADTPCLSRWLGGKRRLAPSLLRLFQRVARESSPPDQGRADSTGQGWTPEEQQALELLRLDTTSSATELARVQRELALQYHPDRGGSLEQMQQVNRACHLLRSRLWAS